MGSLEAIDVTVAYDGALAVHEACLNLDAGETLSIVGPNGAGKSSLLKAMAGLIPFTGTVRVLGAEAGKDPAAIVHQGLSLCPEGRLLFPDMTVEENLKLGGYIRTGSEVTAQLAEVYAVMPRLLERTDQVAGTLSGGEQQMLAIGRSLMSIPRVLMLDEPSQGLAHKVKEDVAGQIQRIQSLGTTVLIVEQDAGFAQSLSERVAVMEAGYLRFNGTWSEFRHSAAYARKYLGFA